MRIYGEASRTEKWDYQTSETVITAVAFLCEMPEWVTNKNGVEMGLYAVGRHYIWLEKAKVDERKTKEFVCEAEIDEVDGLIANRLVIDEKTNEVRFRYVLNDGRIAEFSSSEIVKRRSELSRRKFNKMKNQMEAENEN